jgi:hypothetical protein
MVVSRKSTHSTGKSRYRTTLQKYIAAMGVELKLVVEFPNLPPVTLSRYFGN